MTRSKNSGRTKERKEVLQQSTCIDQYIERKPMSTARTARSEERGKEVEAEDIYYPTHGAIGPEEVEGTPGGRGASGRDSDDFEGIPYPGGSGEGLSVVSSR